MAHLVAIKPYGAEPETSEVSLEETLKPGCSGDYSCRPGGRI